MVTFPSLLHCQFTPNAGICMTYRESKILIGFAGINILIHPLFYVILTKCFLMGITRTHSLKKVVNQSVNQAQFYLSYS